MADAGFLEIMKRAREARDSNNEDDYDAALDDANSFFIEKPDLSPLGVSPFSEEATEEQRLMAKEVEQGGRKFKGLDR